MKPTKFIAGVFEDPELILRAAKKAKESGIRVYDCYTPFVVHGLDKQLGIKRTRLSIAAFLFGCTGFILSLIMQNYMSYIDWPVNIGGKPNTPVLVTFVPVCFESTVLCTALLTIFTFWIKSRMFHGVTPDLFDDRQTSDRNGWKEFTEYEVTSEEQSESAQEDSYLNNSWTIVSPAGRNIVAVQ